MWPESNETQELIVQARGQTPQAIERLFERHHAAVKRLIQLRLDHGVRRRVDVSDVLQEVMLEASRRLQDYLQEPPMSFHLWLRQIAMDRIIDAHRRHRGSAKRSVDREQPIAGGQDEASALDLVQQLADPQYTPSTAAARKEMAKQVEGAIADLPETDAEILVMRHYEQLSNQEVAQVLGLSEPAASMRYLRAIRRLRSTIEGASPGTLDDLPG